MALLVRAQCNNHFFYSYFYYYYYCYYYYYYYCYNQPVAVGGKVVGIVLL